ncbi:hypothetical protein K7X08_011664 [Anisodus acutangulus]|uniref:Uncharacterized protein n=1 Tax=Anisodus acutangulus TaxID=402998 RepID=A0A9Q1MNH3_9SOLA|nr:hypothetical protein K7X08_011664 [Anisodus acutangulus]
MEMKKAMRAQKEFIDRKMDPRDDFGTYVDDTIVQCMDLLRARHKRQSFDLTFFNYPIGVILQIITNSTPEDFHSLFRRAKMLIGVIKEGSLLKFLRQVKEVWKMKERMDDKEREAKNTVHNELNANLRSPRGIDGSIIKVARSRPPIQTHEVTNWSVRLVKRDMLENVGSHQKDVKTVENQTTIPGIARGEPKLSFLMGGQKQPQLPTREIRATSPDRVREVNSPTILTDSTLCPREMRWRHLMRWS